MQYITNFITSESIRYALEELTPVIGLAMVCLIVVALEIIVYIDVNFPEKIPYSILAIILAIILGILNSSMLEVGIFTAGLYTVILVNAITKKVKLADIIDRKMMNK